MAGLASTLETLARYQRALRDGDRGDKRLIETTRFGHDPGDLRMLMHVPAALPPRAALVVALHGCTQTAAGYNAAAGWSTLADRFGFAVLLPEQRRRNNAGGCFNWFEPADTARGAGEAASIRAMVQHAIAQHGLDRGRVMVTGLSAGAAFANVLLATYPDVFAAGALVAGLPYGAAASLHEAVQAMASGGGSAPDALIRGASAHRGAWPRISVWHGLADTVVVPANAELVVRQWLGVHGLDPAACITERVGRATRRIWRDPAGQVAVEHYSLPGLGHALPLGLQDTEPSRVCGECGPFAVEAGLSSSFLIAQSWGLTGTPAAPLQP